MFKKIGLTNAPHSKRTAPEVQRKIGVLTSRASIPIYILFALPAILGIIFVGFGVLYTGGLRPIVFELSWLAFAFVLIGTSIASNAPVIEEEKTFSRAYLIVFFLFVCLSIYSTVAIAPSIKMANYASGISVTAILTGLAAAALKRR